MSHLIGQRFGEYRLTHYIGGGGFADVYLAEHVYLKRLAAIKVLKGNFSPSDIAAFHHEAQVVAQLEHPNIVQLLTYSVEKDTPYLVMSYAARGSLAALHPRGTPLPVATVLTYVKQIASALQYAHTQKIVHRDIKPANFLVSKEQQIVLADFGIAVIAHETRSWKEQELIGTWTYAAPEHFQTKAGPASDQYSLGIVVYEWLCGTPPFSGNMMQLFNQHTNVPPPPLRKKIATLSPMIESVVLKALAKDPKQRFPDIQAFAEAFEQAITFAAAEEKKQAPPESAKDHVVPGSAPYQPTEKANTPDADTVPDPPVPLVAEKASTLGSRPRTPNPPSYKYSAHGSGKIIGIDLGTTNSCVAVIEGGEAVIIPNAEGARTTPSIVAFNKSGGRLVGEVARRQAITNPENTIFSIKRFVGRKYDDPEIERDKRLAAYKVIRANNGDAWIEAQGKAYSPPEISAMILQKLKADAEAYLGERVTQAVITIPAYFNDAQRQATRDAGHIAGLEVLRIINEPTAASLAYGLDKKKDERIIIYDFGGGTFNVSIMELGDGVFEVQSINGHLHLGGDDFDQRIINWLADEFRKEQGIDLRQDNMALQRLKDAAEKAKKELSNTTRAEINLPFIAADANGPKHLTMNLSRSKLEQLVEDLVELSRVPVAKALSDANTRPGDINEVVLVGGQTRMPALQTLVERIFDRKPNRGVNPDEVVAIGAAIQAGVLTGAVKDVLLLDVTPLSLGIETFGGTCTRLIERNTTFPTQTSQVFSTATDNQPCMEINILQGEREFAKDNRSLGSFILDGIPPAPHGTPQIEVTFDIDANGTVNVSARDKGTNREQKITITTSSGLSKDQINRMAYEAASHAAADRRRKEETEERHLADSAAYRAEKSLEEMKSNITAQHRRQITARITDVRAALLSNNIAHITTAREALEQQFYVVSGHIYDLYSANNSKSSDPEDYKDK